ncbi:MAG: ABC transporter permease [Acidobacteria bacterium]|nr:ABC transporter permease [Acidobacteriota bacterium]
MENLLQDLRYAVRMLVKSPAFTAVAVLTLALGIGANTAIFSVVNALLLKSLPVRAPQELVAVGDPAAYGSRWHGSPATDFFSYPLYRELRDRNAVFQGLIAASSEDNVAADVSSMGGSEQRITVRLVSGNYFPVLGVGAAAGRVLTESDDGEDGANPVLVLSYGYWQREFALSPAVLGKTIRLSGSPFTVVGVAQANFRGDVVGDDLAGFVPLSMQPQVMHESSYRNDPGSSWLLLIGRLKSGVSLAQAKANVNFVFQQALKGPYGASIKPEDLHDLASAKIPVSAGGAGLSSLREEYRAPLLLLLGIVGLVLLIACVNVANLLMARATTRSREVAVRLALGASRARLFRQLLTESVALAFVGGACGALLAIWGVRLLLGMVGTNGDSLPISPDGRVLAFTVAVCLLTGIFFGLAPALRAARAELNPILKASITGQRRPGWSLGKGLIVGQVALSLLVLFGATLMVRSLQKLLTQDLGYDSPHILAVHIGAAAGGYKGDRMKQLAQDLSARLAAIPGVRGVTYSRNGLFSGGETSNTLILPGFEAASREQREVRQDGVGPNYFGLLAVPIVMGRGIGAQDTATSTRVAVVNESMVRSFFSGQNPLGRQFQIDSDAERGKPYTIVGVCKDTKDHTENLRAGTRPRFYIALQQESRPVRFVLEVVSSGDSAPVIAEIRAQIKNFDANLPIYSVMTVRQRIERWLSSDIALATLSAFFAGLALLLACIGLYGIMSYTVAGRTREFGVRVALGARREDVLHLVLSEGMLLVGAGLIVGIPLALAGSRLLRSFLFGLKGTDPLSLAGGMALLGVVGLLAAVVPARRATKVDPVVALRYE